MKKTVAALVAATALAMVPTVSANAAATYANCAAVVSAGKAPLLKGQPGYSTRLDRDGDGVACETGSTPAPRPTAVGTPTNASPAPTATSASPTTAAEQALIRSWYIDFLGRKADGGGIAYWSTRLSGTDGGSDTERRDVVGAITRSNEYASNFVSDVYRGDLGRKPDRGSDYWTNGIRTGMAPEWVEQNVLASPEYTSKRGASTVDSWYTAILGRPGKSPANSGEEAYWNGRVSQVGALNAVREIWYTPEAVEFRLQNNFDSLLNREARSYEVDYFYSAEATSDINTQIELAATNEYRDRVAIPTAK